MTPEIDVAALRAATPGCATRAHLNNAGAALVSRSTLDTVVEHLQLEATIGGYEAAGLAADRLGAVRSSAAALIGADDDEVALTTSDTSAWTKAFWGYVLAGGLAPSRRVVVDHAVYNSHHLSVLQAVAHCGATVEVVPAGADGTLDLERLGDALSRPAALVSVTHVPTSSGLVNPVEQAGAIAAAADVPFFLDACQSIGQLPVDATTIRCDVATTTGRKWLRGPRGTGFLYVRREFADRIDPPGLDATSAAWPDAFGYVPAAGAQRAEEFEASIAAQLGLGVAIDATLELGIDRIAERVGALARHLRSRLDEQPGVVTNDGDGRRSGIVTFSVDGRDPDELAAAALAAGINVSVSRSEHARLDLAVRGLESVVRASPHVYNTTDELERLVELVAG